MTADRDAIALASTREQLAALASGEVTSRGLVDALLERIDALNPRLNALVTVDAPGARRQADEADEARRRGEGLGLLHGIPFTVKDAIATGGMRTTAGAAQLRDNVPEADAPAIAALRREGAILMGKSNLPRWSGNIQTSNDVFGTTVNPWDASLTPGGSSGGAAAAVASGLTSFEIGSDLGGSIRIPAHFCGVVGHRPSSGLVPGTGYIDHVGGGAAATDLNVLGPLTRSVADARLLLEVLAGPEPELAGAWRVDLPPARRREAADYRVGLWLDGPGTVIEPEMREIIEAAAERLRASGASVEAVQPDIDVEGARRLCVELIVSAILPSFDEDRRPAAARDHVAWLANRDRLAALRAEWAAWFCRYDALICPVMSVAAFPHDLGGSIGELRLTVAGADLTHRDIAHMWNAPPGVAGLPVTTVPVGRTAGGLPVGVQVIGPFMEDLTPLAVAEMLEAAGGGFAPPPTAG